MAAKLLLLFHTADSNCIKNRQICYIGIKSMSIQLHSSLLHTIRTKAKAICPISAPSVTPICFVEEKVITLHHGTIIHRTWIH